MFDTEPPKVLVGVAAHEDCAAAVGFAAAEAGRRGCGVHLAHVVHPSVLGSEPATLELVEGTLRDAGAAALGDAAHLTERLLPDAAVSTEIVHGEVAPSLARLGSHAALVVLEHQGMGTHRRRGATLSVTNAVAARASVPVVAVPSGWVDEDRRTSVVVGVKDVEDCEAVVRAALLEGRQRRAPVRIVHAWHYNDYFDTVALAEENGIDRPRALRERLAETVRPLLEELDDVEAHLVVTHARPAEALVTESDDAALVVVARHSTERWGPHLGGVVRAVLRESTCPVVVV